MKFSQFSKHLQKLELVSSRLEITQLLSELIEDLELPEVSEGVFLSLGSLGPHYEKVEFGISEKLAEKIIARAFSVGSQEVNKLFKLEGDLGSVAQALRAKDESQNEKLSLSEVYEKLKEMAEAAGEGSVEAKISFGAELLRGLDSLSVRYIVRIPLGTMRLGFSEKTVLEALALSAGGEKEVSFAKGSKSREIKALLENKYNAFPNIGEISRVVRTKGLEGLSEIKPRVFVPILPQLCARLATTEEMVEKVGGKDGQISAEYKYDGVRLQVHLDRELKVQSSKSKAQNLTLEVFGPREDRGVVMYTRNLEQMQSMFPDLTEELIKAVEAKNVILDGEAVGFDPKTGEFIPFQETMQRKRKYDIEEMARKIPVKYFIFDILYKDGMDLMERTYRQRREILLKTIKQNEKILVTEGFLTNNPKELLSYFDKAKNKGLEGLIVKNPDGVYEAGSRGFSWVKFKREETGSLADTIDCIVLGYYVGAGKRSDFGIGAFLVGVYDEREEKFLSLAKIGTGLTDAEWRDLKVKSARIKVKNVPKNVEIKKELLPDVSVRPEIVVQIRADEITISPSHTSGFALRFPRMMGYRTDKGSRQATSLTEIKELYRLQAKEGS